MAPNAERSSGSVDRRWFKRTGGDSTCLPDSSVVKHLSLQNHVRYINWLHYAKRTEGRISVLIWYSVIKPSPADKFIS